MAGSFTSRVALVLAASLAVVSATYTTAQTVVATGWRYTVRCLDAGFNFLIECIRPAKPNAQNLSAWRRCLERAEAGSVQRTEKRRPLVSPRWRLCPSV